MPYKQSDIGFVALRPDLLKFLLPNGELFGPRMIVETKDEQDFDPSGRDFGERLLNDVAALGNGLFITANSGHKVCFTKLKQQHYEVARGLLGTDDFDRWFTIYALDDEVRRSQELLLRIWHVETIGEGCPLRTALSSRAEAG